jgi:hypothetical protein
MGMKKIIPITLLAFAFFLGAQNAKAQMEARTMRGDYGYTGEKFRAQLPENMRTLHVKFGERKKDTLDIDVGRLMDSVYNKNIVAAVGEDAYRNLILSNTETFDTSRFVGKYTGTGMDGNLVVVAFYKITSSNPEKKLMTNCIIHALNQGSAINYSSAMGLSESDSYPGNVNATLMCLIAETAEGLYPPKILAGKKRHLGRGKIAVEYNTGLGITTILNKELSLIINYEMANKKPTTPP